MSDENVRLFLAKNARDVNSLTDPDRFKRKRALDAIANDLFESSGCPSPAVRTAVVLEVLVKPLSAMLADNVESNREATIALFTRTVEGDPSCSSQALVALLPAFTARVGRTPFAEDAEELRYHLARLLNAILCRTDVAGALRSRLSDVADVLKALSSDAFHSVKVEASNAIVHVAACVPEGVHTVLGVLAHAAVGNMMHQRAPVRVTALAALHACMPCGSESLPTLLSDPVIPALMATRFDRTPSVRKQAAVTAADWLTMLPQHALAMHEHKLVALLAAFIADETSEVAEAALLALSKSAGARMHGTMRMDDSKDGADLHTAAEAAAPDSSVAGYTATAALAELTAASILGVTRHVSGEGAHPNSDTLDKEGLAAAAAAAAGLLPHPFRHRPSAPVITLSRRLLDRVLPLLLAELSDWTSKVRLAGAGALRSMVVLSEDGLTAHMEKVLSALITGSRDDDLEVRKMLGHVGRLVGVYTPSSAQLAVLLPGLRGEIPGLANNPVHTASTLAVLAAVLSGMTPASLHPHVPELAEALARPALADTEPPSLRQQMALALGFTVRTGLAFGADARGVVCIGEGTLDCLLLALLQLQDMSAPAELLTSARAIEAGLALALGFASQGHMYASSCYRLLPRITASVRGWTKSSTDRRTFDTLLRVHRSALCGRSTREAQDLMTTVVDTFVTACEPGREAELRVSLLALLDSLALGPDESAVRAAGVSPASPAESHRGQPRTLAAAVAATGGTQGREAAEASASGPGDTEMAVRSALTSGGTPGQEAHTVDDALVDALLSDGASGRVMMEVVAPNLVWRVGMVAATVRKVAVAVALALSRRRLLPLPVLEPIASLHVLPSLTGAASDDDATTRHMAVCAMAAVLRELTGTLEYETVRLVYPELLKRLDDSNDAVRGAACGALSALATAARREAMTGGPIDYTLETLLVHLDDVEGGIQAAVYDACLSLVKLDPTGARVHVLAARSKHRFPAYCDQLLAFIDALQSV